MNTEKQTEPSGLGYLVIHATTARGAIPLEGVQVDIYDLLPEPNTRRGDLVRSTVTGRDGNTERIALPTMPRNDSLSPSNGSKPYTSYFVDVQSEGYYVEQFVNVPIFDGITAIQPANLTPLPENGRTDSRTPDAKRFYESEAPDL